MDCPFLFLPFYAENRYKQQVEKIDDILPYLNEHGVEKSVSTMLETAIQSHQREKQLWLLHKHRVEMARTWAWNTSVEKDGPSLYLLKQYTTKSLSLSECIRHMPTSPPPVENWSHKLTLHKSTLESPFALQTALQDWFQQNARHVHASLVHLYSVSKRKENAPLDALSTSITQLFHLIPTLARQEDRLQWRLFAQDGKSHMACLEYLQQIKPFIYTSHLSTQEWWLVRGETLLRKCHAKKLSLQSHYYAPVWMERVTEWMKEQQKKIHQLEKKKKEYEERYALYRSMGPTFLALGQRKQSLLSTLKETQWALDQLLH